jgi:sugar phosphate isomerase/epimerase
MNLRPVRERLAVCSWSLQPDSPEALVAQVRALGIPRVQLALDPLRENPAVWGRAARVLGEAGVEVVSGMIGFVGEDYTTMESIRRTGGVTPDATWPGNQANVARSAELAAALGLRLVTFHAGFLPHEETDPAYGVFRHRSETVAGLFAGHGVQVAFETGQETAPALAAFLRDLDRTGAGVNFDPANIVLYDNGDPVEALRTLAPWVKQIHIKDGRRTRVPGTWGEEVVAGTGDVDWPAFFSALREVGFGGWCCIEREAGTTRPADIRAARAMVERVEG